MADVPTLPPELCRSVSALARTLVAAARTWALYPPEHPAVASAIERVRIAVHDAAGGRPFSFGVSPDTLLIEAVPLTGREAVLATEAASWLHARDVLQLTIAGDVSSASLHRLLDLLAEDPREVRQRGGPAAVWAGFADPAIVLEQLDFSYVLRDGETAPASRRKDDVWRAIVRSVLDRGRVLDEAAQARLLEIAGDASAIAELARDVVAPHCAADGSPMLTSQAAAVMAAYRHLAGIVEVLSPQRRDDVVANLAAATSTLDPHLVLQVLQQTAIAGDTAADSTPALMSRVMDAFDETRVAQLLATTLAIEGQASQRLATVFDTIAPDEERKRRVLSLARHLLSETDFGRRNDFHTLWSSTEALLLTYNERPFVSAAYRTSLDAIGSRAEEMAREALPPELSALVDTLRQENVRRLSATLLIDLLDLESDAARAPDLARDVATLAEDLLLAGDYASALDLVSALARHARQPSSVAHAGSRLALDGLASTIAFHDAADLLGEMSDEEAATFSTICERLGAAAVDGLRPLLGDEAMTPRRARAMAIVRRFGARAVTRLAPMLAGEDATARRNCAELLGEIAAPEGVPLLQPLLRGQDPRVTAAAVRALSSINDPAAAKAVHTALRAATGDQRRAVVDALVAQRDARVVPVLVRILEDSDPFGSDHAIVLDTVGALAQVGDDHAVPALSTLMRRRKLLGRRKVTAVKQGSLAALRAIQTPAATRAIQDAAANGDRLLRRLARAHGAPAHG